MSLFRDEICNFVPKIIKRMKTISRKELLDYIEHEEIAFQFGDGLMCITHPDGDYGDEDLAQSMARDIEEMKQFIADSQNISVVHKEDVVSEGDKLGFNEFADWSTDTDLLILVDKSLLLCLPNPDTWNVAFEAA